MVVIPHKQHIVNSQALYLDEWVALNMMSVCAAMLCFWFMLYLCFSFLTHLGVVHGSWVCVASIGINQNFTCSTLILKQSKRTKFENVAKHFYLATRYLLSLILLPRLFAALNKSGHRFNII